MSDPIIYNEWFSVEKNELDEHFIVDEEWNIILKKVQSLYPTTYANPEEELNKPYLLNNQIGWGYTDTTFDAAETLCTVNFNLNNSPPAYVYFGGRRRRRNQYIIMEMTYRALEEGNNFTNLFDNPVKVFSRTKRKLESIITSNPRLCKPEGITMIWTPTTLQDGKSFGSFGMLNNFQTPMNLPADEYKWRYVLLFMIHVEEVLL